MGCGKTVAMTFLQDELIRRNRSQIPQPKVCSCYCRDDETGRGLHILCVVILALLDQLTGLRMNFYDWYREMQQSGHLSPEADINKLGTFLISVLASLDRPLFIMIDGLDECDRGSRRYILDLLDDITRENPRVKILVSSRPNMDILLRLEGVPKIEVVADIQRDTAIIEHNVDRQLSYLSADLKTLVVKKLSRLAQGSAIWSRMVIQLISVRGIEEERPMMRFLASLPLPRDLAQIYNALFLRYGADDLENQRMLGTALKFLAVARQLLSIIELAWAVALAMNENVSTVAALQDLVDPRRLLRLLQPFISGADHTDLHRRQIQLVHQSLKEHILETHELSLAITPDRRAGESIGSKLQLNSTVALEAEILNVCVRYLLLHDLNSIYIFTDEQLAVDALPQETDLFAEHMDSSNYDPLCTWEEWEIDMIRYNPADRGLGEFFVYSACHWLDHLGSIDAEVLLDLSSIEALCCAGSTRLHNWIEQNRRPGCTIQPRFIFEARLYDPLSIISLYGSQRVMDHMIGTSDLSTPIFLPRTILKAAEQIILWGEPSRLKSLVTTVRHNDRLQQVEVLDLIIRAWGSLTSKHPGWDVISDLIVHLSDTIVEQYMARLHDAASAAGCVPMTRWLQERQSKAGASK